MDEMMSYYDDCHSIESDNAIDMGVYDEESDQESADTDGEPSNIDDDTDFNPYTGQYEGGEDSYLDASWEDQCEIGFGGDY